MKKVNSTPEQKLTVSNYLSQLRFSSMTPDKAQIFIEMCCYMDIDSMGLIDPIEIAMVRSMVNYPISKALAKNCKMSTDELKAAYNNFILEAI
jgi:hypothetical protein